MDNIFKKFAISYFSWIKENLFNAKEAYTDSYIEDFLVYFFYKKKKIPSFIKEDYESILSKLEYSTDIESKFSIINSFISFIRFAEKCFMFENSDKKNIYAEIQKDQEIIYFKFDNQKVKITFENTKIPDLNNNSSKLLGESTTIKFVTIDIVRTFGKEMHNTFKFILKEAINFEDETDDILLQTTMALILDSIRKSFLDILNSIHTQYTNISEINVDELIRKGVWVIK